MHKEHQEHFADRYRLAQSHKLLRLFKAANGRGARTLGELECFVTAHPEIEKPVKPDDEDFEAMQSEDSALP